MKPGRAAAVIYDDERSGTIDPFATIGVASGVALTSLRQARTSVDVLRFFKSQIDH
jgi:hypothetical protein